MNDKQWYIDYFTYMEEEHKKIPLGGMAWDDVNYHACTAVEKGVFTRQEILEGWPALWA